MRFPAVFVGMRDAGSCKPLYILQMAENDNGGCGERYEYRCFCGETALAPPPLVFAPGPARPREFQAPQASGWLRIPLDSSRGFFVLFRDDPAWGRYFFEGCDAAAKAGDGRCRFPRNLPTGLPLFPLLPTTDPESAE